MTDQPRPDAPATSVAFAGAARSIAEATRRMGVTSPSFRCPPRVVGVDRALRRRGSGADQAVVSVRIKGRAWVPVLADMIDGVIVANRLRSPDADRVRSALWEACGYRIDGDHDGDVGDRGPTQGAPAARAA